MSVSSPDHNDLQMTDATVSTNAAASAPTGARAIFEAHSANENWSIYAAKNFFTMYHPEGCTTCEAYVAHAVSTLRKGELVSSRNPVAKALDDMFPWYGNGCAEDATEESRREIDELRADNKKLCKKYDRLDTKYIECNNLLDEERVLHTIAEKDASDFQNQRDEHHQKDPSLSTSVLDASPKPYASAYDNPFQYDPDSPYSLNR